MNLQTLHDKTILLLVDATTAALPLVNFTFRFYWTTYKWVLCNYSDWLVVERIRTFWFVLGFYFWYLRWFLRTIVKLSRLHWLVPFVVFYYYWRGLSNCKSIFLLRMWLLNKAKWRLHLFLEVFCIDWSLGN